jgi:allophanate hydrolase subunit 2
VAGGVATFFAAAAAAVLIVRVQTEPDWLPSRSTSSLFSAPFTVGERSGRVDVVARGRAADYRENQFLAWGVK